MFLLQSSKLHPSPLVLVTIASKTESDGKAKLLETSQKHKEMTGDLRIETPAVVTNV